MNKCQNCNKETTNPKFCSKSCSATYNNKIHIKRQRTKKCKVCDILISSDRTFCNKECYSKGRSKRRSLKPKGYPRLKSFRTKIKYESVQYKGGKCAICNYNKCIKALEFHHLDPTQKDFSISSISKSFESIKKELDKCILLCANCHREVHAGILDIDKTLTRLS